MNSKVKISIEKLNKIIQDVEHVYLFSGLKDSDFWNTYLKDAKLYISYLGLPKESFDSYIEDLEGITVGRELILWNGGEISIADARKEQEIIVTTLGRIMREVELLNADIIDEVAYNDDTCQRNLETKKVFIVHGHDEAAKEAVARVLTKLGLIPIILHEQKNAGQTIIEKIENNSDVGFAIILYTECDEGRQKGESEYKSRARQNVVFEHGYFIGKIGRDKVMALKKGDVETPGDMSGVVYTPMDSAGSWKYSLGNELKNAGFQISLDDI